MGYRDEAPRRSVLDCSGRLELPHDGGWVLCDRGAGHEDKHSGALDGKRYWWRAMFARVAREVPRKTQGKS